MNFQKRRIDNALKLAGGHTPCHNDGYFMAYAAGFTFDLFISYAHVDNLTAAAGVPGWVEQFHKNLEIEL